MISYSHSTFVTMPDNYSYLARLDRDTQTKFDIIVSAYLEPIEAGSGTWRGVGFMLVPMPCSCGANEIKPRLDTCLT